MPAPPPPAPSPAQISTPVPPAALVQRGAGGDSGAGAGVRSVPGVAGVSRVGGEEAGARRSSERWQEAGGAGRGGRSAVEVSVAADVVVL